MKIGNFQAMPQEVTFSILVKFETAFTPRKKYEVK